MKRFAMLVLTLCAISCTKCDGTTSPLCPWPLPDPPAVESIV